MTFPMPKTLESTEEVVLDYINQLRENLANQRHMMQSMHPEEKQSMHPEENMLARLDEIRAKNTQLEADNRELKSIIEGQRAFVAGMQQGHSALHAEIKKLKETNAGLINLLNKEVNASAPSRNGDVYDVGRKEIDGKAAIVAGREAREAHMKLAQHPERGE
jgi:DNA repair exonuclease SbcCD ATPase subunit